MANQPDYEWIQGRSSLGAAAGWTTEEMRLIADFGYALAEQGCNEEALTIFEGLAALAPATAYFQASLGALYLRTGDIARAIEFFDAALAQDTRDLTALVNRGEAYLQIADYARAEADLHAALEIAEKEEPTGAHFQSAVRARALLRTLSSRQASVALVPHPSD